MLIIQNTFSFKLLMVVSAIGTSLGMCVLGVSMLLKSDSSAEWISYIQLGSFGFIIFIGNCGINSMPFGIIAEILPEKLKGFGISFLMSMLWIFCLIMLKFFPFVMVAIGMHGAAFTFAGVCVVCSAFMLFYMPETKGKSYQQIMASLR